MTWILLWVGCRGKETPPETSEETGDETTPAALEWRRCRNGWECATLSREGAEIAVTRHMGSPPGDRYVVLADGGPGGSSIELAHALVDGRSPFDEEFQRSVNWVAMDNRGVGETAPIRCVEDAWFDEMRTHEPVPATDADKVSLQASRDAFQAGCLADRSQDALLQLGAETYVADLDALRSALGVDTIDFLGISYGTRIGALYAARYPEHTGRFVLDGVFGPEASRETFLLRQAQGFDTALERFFERCAASTSCAIRDDPAGVFDRVLAAVPLPAASDPEGRSLTRNELRWAVSGLLYDPSDSALALGLLQADSGDGSQLLAAADSAWGRDRVTGAYAPGNQGYWAIGCLDLPWPSGWTDEDVWAFGASLEASVPRLGATSLSGELTCSGWPVSAPAAALNAPGAPPLLLVNGLYDPASPLQNALDLQEALGNGSTVVTYEGDGHVALFTDLSGCSFEVERQFLLEGTVGATTCP